MQHQRRLALQAALAGTFSAAWPARAETDYPKAPVRVVVGFPPGQASDLVARLLAAKLSTALGQSVYVDNKPGAAGIISHQQVKSAKADGYTLLMGSTATLAVNPALYKSLPYDPQTDFEPVALISLSPMFLVCAADVPAQSPADWIRRTRANGQPLSYASAGSGTSSHIVMESFKKATGLELLHVPYKGSADALRAIMAGEVQCGFDISSAVMPHAQASKLRLIATTAEARLEQAAGVPTLRESGFPDFVFSPWSAVMAPTGVPREIVARLNKAINQALQDPEMVAYRNTTGSTASGGTPEELDAFLRTERKRWGMAVRLSGAKVE